MCPPHTPRPKHCYRLDSRRGAPEPRCLGPLAQRELHVAEARLVWGPSKSVPVIQKSPPQLSPQHLGGGSNKIGAGGVLG